MFLFNLSYICKANTQVSKECVCMCVCVADFLLVCLIANGYLLEDT